MGVQNARFQALTCEPAPDPGDAPAVFRNSVKSERDP